MASIPFVLLDDIQQLGCRIVQIVVDHNVIVAVAQFNLVAGIGKAKREGLLRLGAAIAQTLGQNLKRRWHDKNQNSFGETFLDLEGSLNINLDNEGISRIEILFDLRSRSALHMPMDICPFDKFIGIDAMAEVFLG